MITSPTKIQQGMQRQLEQWRQQVVPLQARLGWKVGFNMAADQQRLKLPSAMVGYLSQQRLIANQGHYQARSGALLLVEPEVAIRIDSQLGPEASAAEALAAIGAYAAALELVDTTRSVDNDIEEILAGNLFHEGVMLAEPALTAAQWRRAELGFSLSLNGVEQRELEQQRVPADFSTIVLDVVHMLAMHGERLQAGDWIITGAAARPMPVEAGDRIELEMGALGRLQLTIAQ